MQAHRKKIAIGGISTECSTYSSLIQTEDDFESIENLRQHGQTASLEIKFYIFLHVTQY